MNKFIEQLRKMEGCKEAIECIQKKNIQSIQEFWKLADRWDWILLLIYKGYPGIVVDKRVLQELALEFAEAALPYSGDCRQICIDTIYATWQYLDGHIGYEELYEKREIAHVASSTQSDSWSATTSWSATAAAWAAASDTDIRSLNYMLSHNADIIRQYIPIEL